MPEAEAVAADPPLDARVVTCGADLEIILALFREYAEWVAGDLSFQGFAAELAGLPGQYIAPGGVLVLATSNGVPAGCIAVRRWDADACEMKRLYVRPAFQGRGCGRFLAQRAIAWASEAGYRRMLLDTLPTMAAAQGLYERLGFRDVEPYRPNPVEGARFMALSFQGPADQRVDRGRGLRRGCAADRQPLHVRRPRPGRRGAERAAWRGWMEQRFPAPATTGAGATTA